MATYRYRHTIKAIKFTGDNVVAVNNFIGPNRVTAHEYIGTTCLAVMFRDHAQGWEMQCEHRAEPGQWITLDYRGRFGVLVEERFNEQFALVKERHER